MAENTVEKIESTVAVEAVTKADEKVKNLEAEKAAKKAEKQLKRANWKGPLKVVGKFFNVCEDHPVAMGASALLGAAAPVAFGIYLWDKSKKSENADVTVDVDITETEEANEPPFDTEA